MLRAAFCDDDLNVLKEMDILFEKYCAARTQKIVYAMFRSPLEVLAEIDKGMRWDILFLDILMPGQNGIETAKEIRQHDANVKIIFLTSTAEFAVESYTVGAYLYQMKPVCEERFFELMDSVASACKRARQDSLLLCAKNGIRRIDLEKLEYCEVMGRTLLFHLEDGKVLEGGGGMEQLCRSLIPYGYFLRPHRSFLVNMEYIQSISSKTIVMNCGANIPIPHGKYSTIKETYLAYAFTRKLVFIS